FFAGGFGSVRGYESNTLGPRSTPADIYAAQRPVVEFDADGNPVFGTQYAYYRTDGELVYFQADNEVDPFGGDILVEGSAELLFPLPFIKDQSQIRTGFFLDVGNVFDTDCGSTQAACYDLDFGEMRYSVGVGLTWVTGFGPMSFSLAKPLNSGEYDQEEVFQFTLGRGF
ncbi:MAG: BamA/TamA family outer membrane protein, partial [Halioglobus sp.]|nr:BamA/TamA family outer membrane protein [Halioglobus sp.]